MSNDMKYPEDYDIGWEKWVDAYDQELEGKTDMDELEELTPDELEELGIDPELFEQEKMSPMIKSIMTPYGLMPLTEQSLASRHFKFWVGHTNFKLGDGVNTSVEDFSEILGDVSGVESIDIMTPYRFRISIGKMFKDREVMDNIKKSLVTFVKSIEDEQQAESGSD